RLARDVEGAHVLDRRGHGDLAVGAVATRQAALGHLRAHAGLREEGGDARTAGAQLLGERALRCELELELTTEELALELLVLPHVRRRHLADAPRLQQDPETPVVDATVVADDAEVLRALREQSLDESDRIARQTEPADGDGRPV